MTDAIKNFKFVKLAQECKTDDQKIEFFDNHQDAFISQIADDFISNKQNVSKEIDDAFYVYANMKRMTERELDDLRRLSWKNYPTIFKVFLFDFCFLNID